MAKTRKKLKKSKYCGGLGRAKSANRGRNNSPNRRRNNSPNRRRNALAGIVNDVDRLLGRRNQRAANRRRNSRSRSRSNSRSRSRSGSPMEVD